jgi:hypothetical protein
VTFLLLEQLCCRDMRGLLEPPLGFWPGFLGPTWTFAIRLQADFPCSQRPEGDKGGGGHPAQAPPLLLGESQQHALRRWGKVVRHILVGALWVNPACAMDTAYRS